jgi:hypothetical protein
MDDLFGQKMQTGKQNRRVVVNYRRSKRASRQYSQNRSTLARQSPTAPNSLALDGVIDEDDGHKFATGKMHHF